MNNSENKEQKIYVQAPDKLGKLYALSIKPKSIHEAINFKKCEHDETDATFYIDTGLNDLAFCLLKSCAHIGFQNWKIVKQ